MAHLDPFYLNFDGKNDGPRSKFAVTRGKEIYRRYTCIVLSIMHANHALYKARQRHCQIKSRSEFDAVK